MIRKCAAELLGTFWLVLGGCGSAVLAAKFPEVGIGLVGVSLAFGLTVLTMAYAIGHISGCHLNPAVTAGLWAGDRFSAKEILPYWIAQLAGAILASMVLLFIAAGGTGIRYRSQRSRPERLWRRVAGTLFPRLRLSDGGGANGRLPAGDPRFDGYPRAEGVCADRDRPCPDANPPREHPRHEHLGESGAQYRPGPSGGRRRTAAIMDVLGGASPRRGHRRDHLSHAICGKRGASEHRGGRARSLTAVHQ